MGDFGRRLNGFGGETIDDGWQAKGLEVTTARRRQPKTQTNGNGATTGYEADLWRMADALRGSMDAAEYKHVVLGLIFLKYISDAFQEAHARLEAEVDQGADPEQRDEYLAQSIFWVPLEARWPRIQSQARQPAIGQTVDDAMTAIERDNPALRDVLPKDYARPALDKTRLGQLIDLVSNIKIGDAEARSKDVLGRVYEYFLSSSSPAPRARRAASSTPRAASSGCWSRCWSPTTAGSTTPAAAHRACSSSRWNSSRPTPPATAMGAGPRPTSPSTARSPTTPPGGWRR